MSGPSLHAQGVAGDPGSVVHRRDPRAKLLGFTGLTVAGVTAPPAAWPALAGAAAALLAVAVLARIPPGVVVRRVAIVLPLLGLLALSLPFRDDPATVALVAGKALVGTTSAVLLGATTPFPDVLHALERLRVPRLLTLIAALMYRYLFVIAAEAGRMRTALAARGYRPRTALQAGALGRVAIALFLRTLDRSERVHLAMLARGFDGTMPRARALAATRADALFVVALALCVLPLRVVAA